MNDRRRWASARDKLALRNGRNDWYRIANSAAGGSTTVSIYDEIGYFGVTAQDFIGDLNAVQGPIELHLSSPGGDVFDGIAIYSALKQRGDVTVIVDSLAASIASVIAMAGDKVLMGPGSQMMIHDGFAMGIGNAADMRELADLLDKQSDNIAGIYADKTGTPAADWRAAMQKESWYTAQEAVDAKLADGLVGSTPAAAPVAASWDLSIFARFSPANAVDNSPWDGGKAMANGAASDDPAAFYAGICAGRKAGNPHNQDSWALPYKYHPGDAPNAAGTRNALSRLPQTEGLTNEAEARATLEKAMKQVDPDYEPSDTAGDLDLWAALAVPDLFRLDSPEGSK